MDLNPRKNKSGRSSRALEPRKSSNTFNIRKQLQKLYNQWKAGTLTDRSHSAKMFEQPEASSQMLKIEWPKPFLVIRKYNQYRD